MGKKKSDAKDESGFVVVQVRVPECVVKFLKELSAFTGEQIEVEEYFKDCVLSGLIADVDGSDGGLWDAEAIKKRYGLDKLLEDC